MWVNKYIGRKYKWGTSDCVRLVEKIFKDEKGYNVIEYDKEVTDDWYIQNPDRLIREAVKNGVVIDKMEDLKEFDAIFFKIDGVVRHLGVMSDNYGHFIHQLTDCTSRQDDIKNRHWSRRFFCGIRPPFKK